MSRFGRCCICTSSFSIADVTSLRCGHTFHGACIAQWLQNSKTCPHCRKKTTVRDLVKLYFDETDVSLSQSFLDTNTENKVEQLTSELLAEKESMKKVSEVNEELRNQIMSTTKELKLARKKLMTSELKEARLKIVEQSLRDQQNLEASLKLWKARVKASEFYSYLLGKCPGRDESLIDKFLNETKDDIEQKKFFDMLRGQRDKLEKQNQALRAELVHDQNTHTKKKAEYKRKILVLQRYCDHLKAQCTNANRSMKEDDLMIDLNECARKKSFGFSFTADDMDASDLMATLKTPRTPKAKLRRMENVNEESACEIVFDLLSKPLGEEILEEDPPADVPIATSITDKKTDARKKSCMGKRFFSQNNGNFERSNSILDKLATKSYLQPAKVGSSKNTNNRIDRFLSDVKPNSSSAKSSLIILSAKENVKKPPTKNIEVIELDD